MKLSEAPMLAVLERLSEIAQTKDLARLLKPKKIDMSVCFDSGIDCEFNLDKEEWVIEIGKLNSIDASPSPYPYNYAKEERCSNTCRPRFSHIHANPYGWITCPIPEGFIITYWNTNNTVYTNMITYKEKYWKAITMFEIIGIQDGWKL
ncbi:MAG: hypothetical protein DRQ48_01830 [Gammaproteobacteria bacterium]|nr:MAG: hypothetical protein DRQ48_01830 [Gammaproteobacteria bacterium]